MKSFVKNLSVFLCLAALTLGAREKLQPMKGTRMNNVRDFGAVGDGKTKDTAAIQKAIDAGGIVFFPPGVYLSGTLYLKSNGGLDLAPGAVLLASPDKEDYNADDFCVQNAVFIQEKVSGAHFIVAVEQKDIVIRGGGMINGNRPAFYNEHKPGHPKFVLNAGQWRPGQMIFFCECENIRVSDVELRDAPYWDLFLHGCEQVNIRGLRIWNDHRTHNGDGIDIDCSRFVTVSDCIIHTGDDCITLRGNDRRLKRKKPCEYVTITNCILSTPANAFRVGVGTGTVRNCAISNIVVQDCRTAIEICSSFTRGKEGCTIENMIFSNFQMEVLEPVSISSNAQGINEELTKPIRGLRFYNLNGSASRSILIESNHRGDIQDITFSGVNLKYSGGEDVREGEGILYGERACHCAPAAVHIANATKLIFRDVRIQWNTKSPNWKYGIMAENAEILEINSGCDFGRPMKLK